MKFCPQCAQPAADGQNFCTQCGAAVPDLPMASVTATAAPPPPRKSDNKIIFLVLGGIALVIVMPIIIIAAIAYPALVRVRSAANEASAVRSLRVFDRGLESYKHRYAHYPLTLDQLEPPVSGAPDENHAGLMVMKMVAGQYAGYSFHYEASRTSDNGDLDRFELHADPITPGRSGVHHYFSNEDGIIRWDENAATANSPPLRQGR